MLYGTQAQNQEFSVCHISILKYIKISVCSSSFGLCITAVLLVTVTRVSDLLFPCSGGGSIQRKTSRHKSEGGLEREYGGIQRSLWNIK